jgi:hypothetical protein
MACPLCSDFIELETAQHILYTSQLQCFDCLSVAIVRLHTELNNEIFYMKITDTFLCLCVQQPGGGYGEVAETCSCRVQNKCCAFDWLSPFLYGGAGVKLGWA